MSSRLTMPPRHTRDSSFRRRVGPTLQALRELVIERRGLLERGQGDTATLVRWTLLSDYSVEFELEHMATGAVVATGRGRTPFEALRRAYRAEALRG